MLFGLVLTAALLSAQSYYPHRLMDHPELSSLGAPGQVLKVNAGGTDLEWSDDETGSGGLPSGAIILSLTSCPSGFSEVASLSGKFPLGTTNAAGDVTTTGGTDTISSIVNHTHTVQVTDPGHGHTQNAHNHTQDPHSHGMAEGQTDGAGTLMDRSNAASATTTTTDAATATNQASTATNQSNTTGITASSQNPAGGVANFDNRPAFVKVIFCAAD